MNAALATSPMLKIMQGLQKAPWIQLTSLLLLVLFLGVLFVNLTVLDEFRDKEVPLQFSVVNDVGLNGSLFDIATLAQAKQPQSILRTNLNETPYWIYANLDDGLLHKNNQMVFRSRHLVQSSCWQKRSDGELAELVLHASQGRILSADMQGKVDSIGVLCRFRFIGPASLEMGVQTRCDAAFVKFLAAILV